MNEIINALLGDSPVYVVLAYLLYKDWKNSETITAALTRIDMRLDTGFKKLGTLLKSDKGSEEK